MLYEIWCYIAPWYNGTQLYHQNPLDADYSELFLASFNQENIFQKENNYNPYPFCKSQCVLSKIEIVNRDQFSLWRSVFTLKALSFTAESRYIAVLNYINIKRQRQRWHVLPATKSQGTPLGPYLGLTGELLGLLWESLRYSALSIYHFCLKISRKISHSSPVRARYGVLFVNAKPGRSFTIVTVILCVSSR